ncbi:MAG: AsmA-like C-terminal region-containing protein [Pirellulaceae bacterium]|nr:AsmA-like C-terminal region-containing protein [Pirellulaceae bacterium]MDP7018136.1 AsmA-like C-terminal region-containing protein [Pirellulaceae bacterium]
MTLVLVAGVVIVGQLLLRDVDRQLHRHIVDRLRREHPHLRISLKDARLIRGRGIELSSLSVLDPLDPGGPVLEADEIQLFCDTDWRQLVAEQDVRIDRVIVRRVRARAELHESGEFNLTQLLALPRTDGEPPPVRVEDGAIELTYVTAHSRSTFEFRDTQFSLEMVAPSSESPGLIKIEGETRGDHIDHATFDFALAPATSGWALQGDITKLSLTPDLHAALPEALREHVKPLADLRGNASFAYYVGRPRGAEQPLEFECSGKLAQGQVASPDIPYALTNLQADFFCDQSLMRIDNLAARSGPIELTLSCVRNGHRTDSPLHVTGRAVNLPLDDRLKQSLPAAAREIWRQFSPSGVITTDVELTFDGRHWTRSCRVDTTDLSFVYDAFPYPINRCRGKIDLANGILDVGLVSRVSDEDLEIKGRIHNFGSETKHGWVEVAARGPLPIQAEMLAALKPQHQKIIESLHPSGMIQPYMRMERFPGEDVTHERVVFDVSDASVKYDLFPYPISGISGKIEMTDKVWSFDRLTGYNDSAYITADGGWQMTPRGLDLNVLFRASDVPLDHELRDALNEKARRLWTRMNPRGALDHLNAQLILKPGRPSSLDVFGAKRASEPNPSNNTISIQPHTAPYRWENVTGAFRYLDGEITLTEVRGEHGRAYVQFSGEAQVPPDGVWSAKLNRLTVEQLRLDRELIEALPARLREVLGEVQVTGPLRIDGWLHLNGGGRQSLDANWDLTIDIEDGSIIGGERFTAIRGGLRLKGGFTDGRLKSTGNLTVDSLMLRDVQITQLHGPVTVDNGGITFGTWPLPRDPRPVPQVRGKALGGDLSFSGIVRQEMDRPFAFRTRITNANLRSTVRAFSPPGRDFTGRVNLAGRVSAEVNLSGNRKGARSWRGAGWATFEDGEIYQLPLMASLVGLLGIRQSDDSRFSAGDAQFKIVADHIYFQSLNLSGGVFSLRGTGDMDLKRNINLDLYALVGRDRDYVPFVRPVFRQAARSILQVEVTGTLENPEVERKAFPELSDRIQQVFPETINRNSESSSFWNPFGWR